MTLAARLSPLTGPGRLARLTPPLAVGAVAALGAVALHLRDPHVSGSWAYCPLALVGFWCPRCGGLRAVNDLTHVDLVAAASSNLLLVAAAPAVVALWVRRLVACWRGGEAMRRCRPPGPPGWRCSCWSGLHGRPQPAVGAWLAP